MAAVSYRSFEREVDKAKFILDGLCKVLGQSRGRFGLISNGRSQVDVDASNLVGCLLFNVEYVYDSSTRELESLGHATDVWSGVSINLHDTYNKYSAMEILGNLGFSKREKILAGDVDYSIPQVLTGGFGTNFAAGEGLYIEVLTVKDAIIFYAAYPDTVFNAIDAFRELHRHLIQ